MNDLTLIRKNLFRKKLRAVLLTFSIMIAFLIFGALGVVDQVLYYGADNAAADRLVTRHRVTLTQTLPRAYYNRVQGVEGVQHVTHSNWFGGYYQDESVPLTVFAVDPESFLQVFPELDAPPEQRAAFLSGRTCIAIGAPLARSMQVEVGQRIPMNSNIFSQPDGSRSWDMDVCMIFQNTTGSATPNFAFFHYEYFNESIAFGQDQLGWFTIRTTGTEFNDQVAADIDALFANSLAETTTDTEAAFGESFVNQMGDIGFIVTSVSGAAFITILMIVGTTMVMAVNERIKEIAVLKTLGFPGARIFTMVLVESISLCLIGGAFGLLLVMGLASIGNQGPMGEIPGLYLGTETALRAFGLMIGLGLITGIIPAINAHRVKIITALGKQ